MPDEEMDLDHGDNRPADMKLDDALIKLATSTAASLRRSKTETDIRANDAANAKKLGIPPKSYRQAVSMARMMDPGELKDHQRGLKRMLGALKPEVVADLFPDDVERQKKRADRTKEKATKAAAKAAEAKAKSIEAGDTNPRSDYPKRGGAGKKSQKAASNDGAKGDTTISGTSTEAPKDVAEKPWPDDEQVKGGEILDGMLASAKARAADETGLTGARGLGSVADEKPMSQSAQTQAIRDQLGLDKA